MESILVVAQIVALICVSTLSIFLIVMLLRLGESLRNLEKDLKEMATRALPVLENMEYITSRVKSITESVDDQVELVRESMGSIIDVVDDVVALERKVQERLEGPILDTVAFVAAVVKGVRTFLERVRA